MNTPDPNQPSSPQQPLNLSEAEEWKLYRSNLVVFERIMSRFDRTAQTLVKTGGLILAAMFVGGIRINNMK